MKAWVKILKMALALAVVAACSKDKGKTAGGDSCQQFIERSKKVLGKMAADAGKPLTDEHYAKMLADCRKDPGKDEKLVACVVAAANEDAVNTCWQSAFKDYQDAGKKSEVDLVLNRISKNAKVLYIKDAAFPTGSAPLTADCCAQPGHECKPDPAAFTGIWEQLELAMEEPYRFRLAIDSKPDRFEARALVDDDCDGSAVTHTVVVTAENGAPKAEFSTTGSD